MRLRAALVAEHSMLSVRQLRTIWSQISFVCAARRGRSMQQNEGASDQAVPSLKSTCFGCRPAQHKNRRMHQACIPFKSTISLCGGVARKFSLGGENSDSRPRGQCFPIVS